MIPVPVILAHGDLGYPDELLYASFIIITIGYIILSWYQSRQQKANTAPDDESAAVHSDVES